MRSIFLSQGQGFGQEEQKYHSKAWLHLQQMRSWYTFLSMDICFKQLESDFTEIYSVFKENPSITGVYT